MGSDGVEGVINVGDVDVGAQPVGADGGLIGDPAADDVPGAVAEARFVRAPMQLPAEHVAVEPGRGADIAGRDVQIGDTGDPADQRIHSHAPPPPAVFWLWICHS
jgi:hypothetical protein